jgi:EAL domain-containing protein (putative c-di-GMP-specific phosphodiesterase class I)
MEAAEIGLGTLLELAAIRIAQSSLSAFPDHVYLAVNASPKTILSGEFANTLVGMPAERIVLEITEHAHVDDYEGLSRALEPLRSRGVRLAVDDAGAGFSSLQHILQLRPDVIKLDMALTRHIHLDPARRGARLRAGGVRAQHQQPHRGGRRRDRSRARGAARDRDREGARLLPGPPDAVR